MLAIAAVGKNTEAASQNTQKTTELDAGWALEVGVSSFLLANSKDSGQGKTHQFQVKEMYSSQLELYKKLIHLQDFWGALYH